MRSIVSAFGRLRASARMLFRGTFARSLIRSSE
jgi:hypothetical protein